MGLGSIALGALAPIAGSVLSGAFGVKAAGRSIGFQREMAKKAHQYEVEDLRLAGLNPILSGTGGPGAKASGGAQAPTPDFASSARAAMRLRAEIDLINQQARGAQFKADIDGPAAMVGRIATEVAGKVESGVRTYPLITRTGQEAINIADQRPAKDRTPYKGFKRVKTSRAETLKQKARRSRSRRR